MMVWAAPVALRVKAWTAAVTRRTRCFGSLATDFTPQADVRFGSKADMCVAKSDVRFAPNSDRESGLPQTVTSALPPKADMCSALAHVYFGPITDIPAVIRSPRRQPKECHSVS